MKHYFLKKARLHFGDELFFCIYIVIIKKKESILICLDETYLYITNPYRLNKRIFFFNKCPYIVLSLSTSHFFKVRAGSLHTLTLEKKGAP